MDKNKNPYFTKEVELTHPEPQGWNCCEDGLWMYNLMERQELSNSNTFDAAFKRAVKMLNKGKTNGKPRGKSKRKQ